MGYVIAAYAIVIVTIAVYWGALVRQRRSLERQLRARPHDTDSGAA